MYKSICNSLHHCRINLNDEGLITSSWGPSVNLLLIGVMLLTLLQWLQEYHHAKHIIAHLADDEAMLQCEVCANWETEVDSRILNFPPPPHYPASMTPQGNYHLRR